MTVKVVIDGIDKMTEPEEKRCEGCERFFPTDHLVTGFCPDCFETQQIFEGIDKMKSEKTILDEIAEAKRLKDMQAKQLKRDENRRKDKENFKKNR